MNYLGFTLGVLVAAWPFIIVVFSIQKNKEYEINKLKAQLNDMDDAIVETRIKYDKQIDWFKRNSIRESTAIRNLKKLNSELVKENADLKTGRYNRTRRK